MEFDFAEIYVFGSAVLFILMFPIEICIIGFSKIELNKRKILIALDFLGITLLYTGFLLFLSMQLPLALPFAITGYMIIYNLILFKIVKKFILIGRAQRIKEEITDHILDALRSLAELDYKSAYEILESALKKHPDSIQLKRLKTQFETRLKTVKGSVSSHNNKIEKDAIIKKISGP